MYRIGIDLGGTNIAVGVVNDRYEIVARRSVPHRGGAPGGGGHPGHGRRRGGGSAAGGAHGRWTAPLWALAPPVPATPRRGW